MIALSSFYLGAAAGALAMFGCVALVELIYRIVDR